jgi:DNA polymerase-3 subunit chi
MNTSLSLYQTNSANLNKSVCLLLSKCYKEGLRTLALVKNSDESAILDNLLWSFSQKNFIPHALSSDPLFDEHPIIISTEIISDKKFDALISIEKFEIPLDAFEKVMVFFTSESKDKAIALQNNITHKQTNYYIQNPNGEWHKNI